MRQDPVAEISGNLASAIIRSPTTSSVPITSANTPGWPIAVATRSAIVFVATAVNGASSDGFHTVVSPHTAASIAFHPHTAFGKLNAVITPIGPKGSHCSISRCCARSLGIVSPCNCLDNPTAKSAMSIVSCTSPSPSDRIFPTSSDTRAPSASLCLRISSPIALTTCPRTGAGTERHLVNASADRPTVRSYDDASSSLTPASASPVAGFSLTTTPSDALALITTRGCASRPSERRTSVCVARPMATGC